MDVAQRSEHEKDGNVGGRIVHRNRRARHLDSSLAACCYVDVVVSCAVVADELQALWQHLEELLVEVPSQWVRVVAAVQSKDTVEFAFLAPLDEVCAVALRVLMELRCYLRDVFPCLPRVGELSDQERCAFGHTVEGVVGFGVK